MASTEVWREAADGMVCIVTFDADGDHTVAPKGAFLFNAKGIASLDDDITLLLKDSYDIDLLGGEGVIAANATSGFKIIPDDRWQVVGPMTLSLSGMASGTCTVEVHFTGKKMGR